MNINLPPDNPDSYRGTNFNNEAYTIPAKTYLPGRKTC